MRDKKLILFANMSNKSYNYLVHILSFSVLLDS